MLTKVKIRSIEKVTHDVLGIVTEKPKGIRFNPGQAAEISINKPGWEEVKRPFTFTCLPDNDYLEFTIKTYPSHKGVTNQLLQLKKDDELILHDVFGAIAYKDEGVFIAGGAGITPFISILRSLKSKDQLGNNKLIFANKTRADVIYEQELRMTLGKKFISILSDEKIEGYEYGMINESLLKQHIGLNNCIYLCGPPPMMEAVEKHLAALHVNKELIVKEAI